MRRNKLFCLIILLQMLNLQPTMAAGVSKADQEKSLQNALKLMDKKPLLAEQQLRSLSGPDAKVFRAYLYMTNKVRVPNAAAQVDKLMHQALVQTDDTNALGEINPSTKYHYSNLTMLLTHLRFITDASSSAPIPVSIFREYPLAAFEAFKPYWGSTRDGFLNVADYSDNVSTIKEVAQFHDLLEQILGNPASTCNGTMRYMYFRKQALAMMKASLAPAMFLPNVKRLKNDFDPQLNDFMEVWSNKELWNKVKYKQYMLGKGRAQVALQKYYAKRLKIDEALASECSKNAIEAISCAFLSEYSHSTMEQTRARPIYKLCTRPQVTSTDLARDLAGIELSPSDLSDGLRYCILNDADTSAISWLIKKGASVSDGAEPLIFTAVLRPDFIAVLTNAGAGVDEANKVGKTALFQAVQFDSLDAVKKLHAAGAKISQAMVAVDSDPATEANDSCIYNYTIGSRTPLHYAAMFASYPVIRYLIDNGADKTAKDSNGATALKMLTENKLISKFERETLTQLLQGF